MTADLQRLHEAVREHGWLVVSGPLSPDLREATSTVGLTSRGLAELVVVGLDPQTAGALLHELAGRLAGGEQVDDGAPVAGLVAGGTDPRLDEALRPHVRLPAADLYGDDVVVRQLVWTDARGRLPGDPGFAHPDLQRLVPGDPLGVQPEQPPQEWPLPLDPHTPVRSSRPVVEQGAPVLIACRDEDGGWLFLDGASDFVEETAVQECLHDALERDLSLIAVAARLTPGEEAERSRPGMPWRYE